MLGLLMGAPCLPLCPPTAQITKAAASTKPLLISGDAGLDTLRLAATAHALGLGEEVRSSFVGWEAQPLYLWPHYWQGVLVIDAGVLGNSCKTYTHT